MRPARAARPSRARESGASAGRSCLPRVPSARPLAASAARTLPDPPDAGPGDAVLPPGRSTRPGPFLPPASPSYPPCHERGAAARRSSCLPICWMACEERAHARGTCPLAGGCPWVMRPIEPNSQILVMSRPPWRRMMRPSGREARPRPTALAVQPGRIRGEPRGPAPGSGSDGGR